jgi:hypothetical protein
VAGPQKPFCSRRNPLLDSAAPTCWERLTATSDEIKLLAYSEKRSPQSAARPSAPWLLGNNLDCGVGGPDAITGCEAHDRVPALLGADAGPILTDAIGPLPHRVVNQ